MYEQFSSIAKQLSPRVAISNEAEQCSFAELRVMAELVRPLLRSASDPAVVLVMMPGGPRFAAVQLAAISEGAVVAAIPEQAKPREVASYLSLVQPDLAVVDDLAAISVLQDYLRRPITLLLGSRPSSLKDTHRVVTWSELGTCDFDPVSTIERDLPTDTSLVLFTSGSTGRPKGVLLSLENIRSYLESDNAHLGRFTGNHVFCPMPQFHAFGCTVVLEHLAYGASVHLANTYMPGDHLARIRHYQCSSILGAPNYIRLLLEMGALTPKNTPDITSLSMGSAAVGKTLVDKLQSTCPGVEVIVRYGLTETMGPVCRLRLKPGEKLEDAGLVGLPVKGVELAPGLVCPGAGDPGQVRIRSKIVAAGQLFPGGRWRTLVDADGYFSTGDLGFLDQHNRLYLRGRSSTFIKHNGFRIDPTEIEAVLSQNAEVAEAVVLGIPDPLSGERIVACVEGVGSRSGLDEQSLIRLCREQLSVAKVPQEVRVLDSLPRTRTGKPDRILLKKHLQTDW